MKLKALLFSLIIVSSLLVGCGPTSSPTTSPDAATSATVTK